MTHYFVSRHERAHFWLKNQIKRGRIDLQIDHWLNHLDTGVIRSGDVVVGTLPFGGVIDIQARGGRHVALVLNLPEDMRGRELSATEMAAFGARLIDVEVRQSGVAELSPDASPTDDFEDARREVHVAFVSDQLAPLVLAAKQYRDRIDRFLLLATPRMEAKAKILQEQFCSLAPFSVRQVADGEYKDHLDTARSALRSLHADHPGHLIVADVTTGTKPMGLALSQACAELRSQGTAARTLYTDTDNDRFEWLAPAARTEPMQARLSLTELLAMQGLTVIRIGSNDTRTAQRIRKRRELTALIRSLDQDSLSELHGWKAKAETEANKAFKRRSQSSTVLRLARPSKHWDHLQPVFDLALKCGVVASMALDGSEVTLQSRDAFEYLGGRWFEEWLWTQLDGIECDAKALGVQYRDGKGADNELDIVLAHSNRLLLIEAKASRLSGYGEAVKKANREIYTLDAKGRDIAQLHATRLLACNGKVSKDTVARATRMKVSVLGEPDTPGRSDFTLEPVDAIREFVCNWVAGRSLTSNEGKPSPHYPERD